MTYCGHMVSAQISLIVQYFKAKLFMCKLHEVIDDGPLIYYQIPSSWNGALRHKSVE